MARKKSRKYTPKPTIYLPGDPGYRNRGNRTGLDPYETSLEAARIEGIFIRRLLTGKLRVRNPFGLLGLLGMGLLFVSVGAAPIYVLISEPSMRANLPFWFYALITTLAGFVGLAMIVTFFKNVAQMMGIQRWWRKRLKLKTSKKRSKPR